MSFSAILDLATPFTATRIAEEMRAHWTAAMPDATRALPAVEDTPADPDQPNVALDLEANAIHVDVDPRDAQASVSRAFLPLLLTVAVGELAGTDPSDIAVFGALRDFVRRATDPRDLLILATLPGWIPDREGAVQLLRLVSGAHGLRFLLRTAETFRTELAAADPELREAVFGSGLALVGVNGLHPLAHLALAQDVRRSEDLLDGPGRLAKLAEDAAAATTDTQAYHTSLEPLRERLAEALGMDMIARLRQIPHLAMGNVLRYSEATRSACQLASLVGRAPEAASRARSGPQLLDRHPAQAHREDPRAFFLAVEEAAGRKLTDDELGRFVLAASGIPALVERGWIEPASRRIHTRIHGSS